MTEPKKIKRPSPKAKQDCFAYSAEQFAADGGCTICKPLLCETDRKCPFYKPKIKRTAERRQK